MTSVKRWEREGNKKKGESGIPSPFPSSSSWISSGNGRGITKRVFTEGSHACSLPSPATRGSVRDTGTNLRFQKRLDLHNKQGTPPPLLPPLPSARPAALRGRSLSPASRRSNNRGIGKVSARASLERDMNRMHARTLSSLPRPPAPRFAPPHRCEGGRLGEGLRFTCEGEWMLGKFGIFAWASERASERVGEADRRCNRFPGHYSRGLIAVPCPPSRAPSLPRFARSSPSPSRSPVCMASSVRCLRRKHRITHDRHGTECRGTHATQALYWCS